MARIPNTDNVWRIAEISRRDKANKAIPSIKVFSFSQYDDGKLSVDWNKLTTPEQTIARVGMSYKKDTTIFKEYNTREIYALNVSFLNDLGDYIKEVTHDPVFNNPEIIGTPNNPAHSLICCNNISDFDMPEFLTKLRDHAKNQLVGVNMEEVNRLVSTYRDSASISSAI